MVRILSTVFAVTGLFVVGGLAQSWPSGFPQCGVTCVNNVLAQTGLLGCNAGDAKCFCSNANFFYGVRDCSDQSCGNQTAAGIVQDYGRAYCNNAGQPTPITTALNPTATNPAGGAGAGAGTGATTGTGAGATGGQGQGQSSSAVTTSAIVTVITSGGSTVTSTIGSTTIFTPVGGAGGAGAASSSGSAGAGAGAGVVPSAVTTSSFTTVVTNSDGSVSTATRALTLSGTSGVVVPTTAVTTSPLATTITSGGSTFVSTTGSTVITSSTRPPNFAAQVTAAPGLLAAAGIVALLL